MVQFKVCSFKVRLDIKYVRVVLMFYVYAYLICDTLIKHYLLTYLE